MLVNLSARQRTKPNIIDIITLGEHIPSKIGDFTKSGIGDFQVMATKSEKISPILNGVSKSSIRAPTSPIGNVYLLVTY